MEQFTKQPNEALDYDIVFSEVIPDGDTVTGTLISVDGSVFAPSFSSDGLDISVSNGTTTTPKLWISEGTDAATYLVSVQVSTSGRRIKESDFRMVIREIN